MTATSLTLLLLLLGHALAQSSSKKNLATSKPAKPAQCCDEVRSLKVQVANLSSILEEMSKKQESDLMKVVRQMMELEKLNQQHEARVTEAESKYSEIYNQIEIMQLQAAQSAPQQSTSGESWHTTQRVLESLASSTHHVLLYFLHLAGSQVTYAGCWHTLERRWMSC